MKRFDKSASIEVSSSKIVVPPNVSDERVKELVKVVSENSPQNNSYDISASLAGVKVHKGKNVSSWKVFVDTIAFAGPVVGCCLLYHYGKSAISEWFEKRKSKSSENEEPENTEELQEMVEDAHFDSVEDLETIKTDPQPMAGLLIPKNAGGVLIYGEKGCLKSYIVLHLLCQLVCGLAVRILPVFDPFFGVPSPQGIYGFYVDAENGSAEIKKRIRKYIPLPGMKDRFKFMCTKQFGSSGMNCALKAFKNKFESIPAGSIVIGCFDNLHSLLDNANSQKESKEFLNGVKNLSGLAEEKGITFLVLIVHHENSEGKAYGSSVFGALTPNVIHVLNTKVNDQKCLVCEHHRTQGTLYDKKEILLDVLHSGPAGDEDLDIVLHESPNDRGKGGKGLHLVEESGESAGWNSPEVKQRMEDLYNELSKSGKQPSCRLMEEQYKEKYGNGPSHTVINGMIKEFASKHCKAKEGEGTIVA